MPQAARVSPDASVGAKAEIGSDVLVGARAVIHDGARVGAGSRIGSGSVLHGAVELGQGCTVEELVVLGKRPRLRAGSSAASAEPPGRLVIEDGVTVCAGAVMYAGAWVGSGAIIGDQAQVRERARIGPESVVGRGSSVDFDVSIGARVLIQTGVYLTGRSVVEDDVFIGPGVVTTNDHTMGRHAREEPVHGPVLRRAARVGGGVVILPGVEIGEEAFLAAGAVVTRDVGPRQVVVGVPGAVLRQVSDEDLIELWR